MGQWAKPFGKGGFNRPLEGSSVNHENDYYKILKFIDKSKLVFTNVDNENNIYIRD